jgi:outer membrane protein TolC
MNLLKSIMKYYEANTIQKYFLSIVSVLLLSIYFADSAIADEALTWVDCVKIASENNPDLQSAAEKTAQAKAGIGIARSALLPQIDTSASISKSKTDTGNSRTSGTSDSYSYGITGKQLLFDSGKTIYDTKSSEKKAESLEYNYQVVSATIRQNLRYSFVKLLSTQEIIKTDKDIAKIRRDNYELVNMRYKAGLEHMGSLLTADANLAQAEVGLSQDSRNLALAQRNLTKNMGLEKVRPYIATGEFKILASYDQRPDFDMLANLNPQLKNIIQQRIGAEYALASSKLDNSPRLYGILSADRTGPKWPPEINEYSAGVQMSFNLFQGGKNWYQTSQADALYKQMFADERSTHNTIIAFLEQAWINLQNNIDTVGIQQKFLKAAEERAKIADAQYSIGTIFFDNWIIIQNTLVNSKQAFLNAVTNALLSEADWIQAKGGTLNYGE